MLRPGIAVFVAALAAALLVSSSHPLGQAPAPPLGGRSIAIAGAGDTLPAALDRVDALLRDGQLDIVGVQEDTMIAGRVHERLGQYYRGVPVFGAQVVRQMDGRSVVSVMGRIYEGLDLNVVPSLTPERAGELALSAAPTGSQVQSDIRLGIFPLQDGSYRLTYRTRVRSDWTRRDVYVDAHSGEIVRSINGLRTQAVIGEGTGVAGVVKKMSVNEDVGTFQAVDTLRPGWTYTFDFKGSLSRLNAFLNTSNLALSDLATDSDNVWQDGPTVDAHVYTGWVYDYYFKRHGRRGIDDHNLEVGEIVHPLARTLAPFLPPDYVGTYVNNAVYLGGGLLLYGDGDGVVFNNTSGALDVVAHEWTHGVTEFSSDLIYRDESGALNEAFSDIMAASIEFYYQPLGTSRDQADWQIAEDAFLLPPGYLRSLNNPGAAGDPDHYSRRQFIGTDIDDGGVHFNLTIATHAYYLAVAGGRNLTSNITVPGVGFNNIERMERIFYRAFVMLMGPSSNFSDARRATLQAAADLYGPNSNERSQVEQAWTAVGVQ
jgi:bacillolysin